MSSIICSCLSGKICNSFFSSISSGSEIRFTFFKNGFFCFFMPNKSLLHSAVLYKVKYYHMDRNLSFVLMLIQEESQWQTNLLEKPLQSYTQQTLVLVKKSGRYLNDTLKMSSA